MHRPRLDCLAGPWESCRAKSAKSGNQQHSIQFNSICSPQKGGERAPGCTSDTGVSPWRCGGWLVPLKPQPIGTASLSGLTAYTVGCGGKWPLQVNQGEPLTTAGFSGGRRALSAVPHIHRVQCGAAQAPRRPTRLEVDMPCSQSDYGDPPVWGTSWATPKAGRVSQHDPSPGPGRLA